MKRTGALTGFLCSALLAALPGCGDEPCKHLECGGLCVQPESDPRNCGACGRVCAEGQSCVDFQCVGELACAAPEQACGSACVNTQTAAEHCGACDAACAPFADCLEGACAAPLATVQTVLVTKGTVARDLYALQDVTLDLTQLGDAAFAGDRVIDHAILPDGRVLLVAAQTEGRFELFLVSPRGGALTRVSGTLGAGGSVRPGIAVSRDGRRVLYRADRNGTGVVELFAVDLANPGTAAKISAPLVAGGEVSRVFALSGNGRRAAYIADQDVDDLNEAYTVDLTAAIPGAPVKLHPNLSDIGGSSVYDLQLSDDGARVVYRRDAGLRMALFAVETANPSTHTLIDYADGAEGFIDGYRIAPDSSAVYFTGGSHSLDLSLWHAPIAPVAEATRLVDGRFDKEHQWVRRDLVVSPDGARVYFRKVSGSFGFDRLYRVDVATPGTIVPLSSDGTTSADEVADFALSADGTSLVYRGGADGAEGGSTDPGTDEPFDRARFAPAIYHVDLTATPGTPTLLSPAPVLDHDGIASGYGITADGRRVVYRADHDRQGSLDAYLGAVATAGTVTKVSPPLGSPADATDVAAVKTFR